jgi:MFS family permease
MTGFTLGFLLGPPISGLLNQTKLGYRAPFILSITVCIFDFFGRLFVLEKHEAAPWLVRTHTPSIEASPPRQEPGEGLPVAVTGRTKSQMSVLRVIVTLGRSKRAFTAFFNTFIYG